MFKSCKKLIESNDLFKTNPYLVINEKEYISSPLSQLLTFLFLVITTY